MSRNRRLGHGSTILVLLLFAAALAVAQNAPASGIAGSWEFRSPQGALRFVFDANGSGSMNGVPFQWALQGDELAITMQGNSVSYQVAIGADEMRLSGGDLMTAVTLTRAGAGSGAAAADTRIQGKWQAANGAVIEFRSDGTGSNGKGTFHYAAADGVLTFDDGMSSLLLTYQIEGNELVFTSNGDRATFVRAGADATVRQPAGRQAARSVLVNRKALREEEIRTFETQFQVRILDGKYWYDPACGAWGLDGGPCVGFLPAKLALGGPLPADASGGGTGVFVNGRELHPMDVAALQQITVVQPGRFWVDAMGNCGYEGNPTPIVNLVQLANAARARSGGTYHSRSDITGIGSGGDGKTSYVMGKDWSVVIGD
jgi:hypothetical protein